MIGKYVIMLDTCSCAADSSLRKGCASFFIFSLKDSELNGELTYAVFTRDTFTCGKCISQ